MIDPLDPKLAKEFDKLRSVPNRDDEKAIKGRAIFLAESHRIQQTVSNSEMLRHKGWNHNKSWTTRIFRKETSPMFTTLVSAFLTIVLILGGSGVTVAAAQSSNSDDFLYPLKLFSEDIRLDLTGPSTETLQLEMEFLKRRSLELQDLVSQDKVASTGLTNRIQNEINSVLQAAVGLDLVEREQILQQIRTQMQLQEQLLQKLQDGTGATNTSQLRTMLQDRIRLLDYANEDPLMTQDQLQQKIQDQIREQTQLKEQEQLQNRTQQPSDTGNSQPNQYQTGQPENPNGNGSTQVAPDLSDGYGYGQTDTPGWPTEQPNGWGGSGKNRP